MTLPVSGPISINNINTELNIVGSNQISFNDTNFRTLLGKPSGQISLADGYGKSNIPPEGSIEMHVGSSGTGAYGYDTGAYVGIYGGITPKKVMLNGSLKLITGVILNSINNETWLMFDWDYTGYGNLYITYNSIKYTFVQNQTVGNYFMYVGSIPGLFDIGQIRNFTITTT